MAGRPKVILYNAMSIDGKIAKADNSTPWSKEEWNEFHITVRRFGNIVIGRRTFDIMKGTKTFQRCGGPMVVVLSRSKRSQSKNIFFTRSPNDAISLLYEQGFARILLGGGSILNRSFLNANLVDEIWLDIEPLFFGEGVPICRSLVSDKEFTLIGIKKLSKNLIQARYKVVK